MTANIMVSPPYQPFTLPNKFSAVFNGEVWCGLVDKDPLVPENQVQVYLVNEDGSRTKVNQPLRINFGGFLVYNGNPAKFVTDSNYSILVRDALKRKVWYEPNVSYIDPETLAEELAGGNGGDMVGWKHLTEMSTLMKVSGRLRKKIYSSDLGVTSETSADYNKAAMQWMIDQSSANGFSAVFDVSCRVSDGGVIMKSGMSLLISDGIVIKAADGYDSPVLTQGANPGLSNVYIEGGVLDGNKANAPKAKAVSVIDFGVCSNIVLNGVTARNGTGYGFAFQARPQSSISPFLNGIASNVIFNNCHAINNGDGKIGGTDTYDGFDLKYVEGCVFTNCSAVGNSDKGFDTRGDRVFMSDCRAVSNGVHGFGFSASFSDYGYSVKGSFMVNNLFADNNGGISFYFTEGLTGNSVRYSVHGTNLISKNSKMSAFRTEAPNADILVSNLEARGSVGHAVYVAKIPVNSLTINGLLVRDCDANGIVVDPGATAPITFSNIDVISAIYGAALYSPEAVIFNGGRLSGIANGPIRVDTNAATPIMNGIVDGDITYKKGEIINNSSSSLDLKLGLNNVIVKSTSTINTIKNQIDGREVVICSSGGLTFQNSGEMRLRTSPKTVPDGDVIKFISLNGVWREL